VAHYRSASKLLDMPNPPNIALGRKPEINIKLGNALMRAEGYNSEEGRQAFERARSAAAKLELHEEYARAGIGIAPLLFGQCRYREVIDIGQGISTKLLQHLRPQTRVHLWTMLGVANYCIGEFEAALEYETRAAKLDDDVRCTHENSIGGGDPAVVCRSYAGVCYTALGLLEQSVARSEEAWDIANARGHAFSIAWAALARMRSLIPLGRNAESVEIGDVCVSICELHGFNARLGNVLVFRGAARLGIGEPEEGLADIRRGLTLWRRVSGAFHLTQMISEVAKCLLHHKRTFEAEQVLREAEEIIEETEEQSHRPEIHRLRGQLHEVAEEREQAIFCYQQALEWSGFRQAKLFELRAGTSLARLWRDQGKRTEARDLLGPIYNWFTEGFDAPDLKDAKALLDDLT
jgi:tetratricopeptide (TPR) repeat protein